ncbi:MAG: 3-hydroxyacyl-ACP dehydratase FabZ [Clostridia bacterium]|nr:3-hydroxyacyl-ACP dehydratase FabZ [Clostridia bacterium]
MNKEEIMKILPHRDNMLLVDESEVAGDNLAKGRYKIKGDEFFLQGHFPGNPVVPGVILCEIMAQTSCVLLADKCSGATPFFSGLNNVKFKKVVRPGDTLEVESTIVKSREPFYFAQAKGYVDGKLCVSAEFSFALVRG